MPPAAKRFTQAEDGLASKRRRTAKEDVDVKVIDHIVELLPHSELKDLVLDLVKDPAISTLVIEHLKDREHVAAQATYDSLIANFEEFETEVRSARYGGDIWGYGGLEVPDFWEDIDLLRKAGHHGLELAWQALLRIADNFKHNGEQGYGERDGPNIIEDDDFHWDVDCLMLECCIQFEAQAPEHFDTTSKIHDLGGLRKNIAGFDIAYRYFYTMGYLKWVQDGKVGDYEDPNEHEPEPVPGPVAKPESTPQPAGGRTKQTARKRARSVLSGSKYMLAFAGREDYKDHDDESSETSSLDHDIPELRRSTKPRPAPRPRTKQTARKRAPSTNSEVGLHGDENEDHENSSSNGDLQELWRGSPPPRYPKKATARKCAPSMHTELNLYDDEDDDDQSSENASSDNEVPELRRSTKPSPRDRTKQTARKQA
ncbi:hypothetical protein MMC14_009164, partial [Varicellaria rhodocarpa]|nr:hypothetical protein [Varicellaria rhodocarpa]